MAGVSKRLWLSVVILCVLQNQHQVRGSCPDQDKSLKRWSSDASWPDGKKPGLNDEVNIDSAILLDESPPELHHITIQPNGRLVWSQEGDFNLTLKHILVFGSMEIGSEDCTFKRKTHILLRGMRGQYSISIGEHLFGEKFIGIAPGGTLEIHGEKKLSWTKLTKTVPKLIPSNGLVFNHQDSSSAKMNSRKAGIVVYAFDHINARVMSSRFYDIGSIPRLSRTDSSDLTRFINDVPHDEIIALALNQNVEHPAVDLKPVFRALRGLGFNLEYEITHGHSNDAVVFIAQKGHPHNTKQALSPYVKTDFQHATATLTVGNHRYSIESFIDNANSDNSRVDFRVTSVAASHPILNLLDDVSTWNPGKKLKAQMYWLLLKPSKFIIFEKTSLLVILNIRKR
ncbi:hypothetical protein LOTGIDRAFT_228688 [Lottia gigantea]|uniref:G8 domain-containing protein n=1 Tax=Lottia gigantea TaxID=225164 RepID=V4BY53_LOTGI|nr:hypothetical protein LOTGIDRAFT_228688 [Lottia gigantea]ESO94034.1 hypothetical protein LOTGIDRAFT_228688 [Lottia gigantea]